MTLVYVAALTVEAGMLLGPAPATTVYLATSALAAVGLAVRHPTDYVLFSLATWIGASEVRRVTDWLAGEFNPYSLASVTPYAVVLAGLLGLLGRGRG